MKLREFDPALAAGIHFYATIWRYSPSQECYADRTRNIGANGPLTARTNRKDSESWLGDIGGTDRTGDPSYRFETRDDALRDAVEDLRATYGYDFPIELGDHISLDHPVLVDAHRTDVRPEALEDGARTNT